MEIFVQRYLADDEEVNLIQLSNLEARVAETRVDTIEAQLLYTTRIARLQHQMGRIMHESKILMFETVAQQ
ncbi:MAG: hypothetical protein AAFP69_20705 [Planctomycetota bacterium]